MDVADDMQDREQQAETSNEEIIVRADEVDETGADISTISPTDGGDFEARVEARRQQDIRSIGGPKILANAVSSPPKPPARPILRRDGSGAPPPPKQPPPPVPPSQEDAPLMADSLSLAELKNMVKDFPKSEAAAYAYEYEDTRTFPEELEEWFQYTVEDNIFQKSAKIAFMETVTDFDWKGRSIPPTGIMGRSRWLGLPPELREILIDHLLQDLSSLNNLVVTKNLECISYIAMGVPAETTWLEEDPRPDEEANYAPPNDKYRRAVGQLRYIHKAADMLCRKDAIQILWGVFNFICENDKAYGFLDLTKNAAKDEDGFSMSSIRDRQLSAILTTLYFVVESGRQQAAKGEVESIRQAIVTLQPNFLHYLTSMVAKLRWDDGYSLPLTRVLLLLWKAILLDFGGTKRLIESKIILHKESEGDANHNEVFLTASPLDYHIFRQEITSKYPAYNPPPPLVPLELNNSSILPPLHTNPSRTTSHESLASAAGMHTNGIGKSIFHQPVHISTPAPSPPPSPAGPGGKGGKKQNYQTNQNFPFLYPPLDDTSNTVGGKGNAGLQDKLVGKKWEGCDIPASILEAGQLFASRMRMSRSLRQLWEVREEFIKFERGWEDEDKKGLSLEKSMLDLDLEDDQEIEDSSNRSENIFSQDQSTMEKRPIKETGDEDVQGRLDAVESFYRDSLPHLQSIVIVLLKVFLSNVTVLGNQAQNGTPNPFTLPEAANEEVRLPKSNLNLARQVNGIVNSERIEDEAADSAVVELNAVRCREITSKAVAGILLMLLKWFKLSHILKFEYLTQLLLDSNYVPLALKFFSHQEVDNAVHQRNDRDDLDFFHNCRLNSGHPPSIPVSPTPSSSSSSATSSSDEALPPPILKHRPQPSNNDSPPPSPGVSPSPPPPRLPEVDSLGHPTTALPPSPLTTYAPRFFHTTITHLRLLQKITKRKAHRALLLVQYKSSTILRRLLKIPQHALRLYTLKLFKAQVPYCGRKWRQTNMRVITAIYLHCRPELRDEWISGGGVEEAVEEAVPLERAGRALVHWWHLRGYRAAMGMELGGRKEEGDFFARELERMGWPDKVEGLEEGEEGREWEGPLAGEGW
ncbi:Factor arrest protein 11 [Xylographa opegraphella]|nr:Factor arrest protein 11 [Xylographa opegraphella]